MQTTGKYECAFCGQENQTEVDPSAGLKQEYVEECQVCCRPNLLRVEFSPDGSDIRIEAERENS